MAKIEALPVQQVLGASHTLDGSHVLLSLSVNGGTVMLAFPFESVGPLLAAISTSTGSAQTARRPDRRSRHTLPVEALHVRPEPDRAGVILDVTLPGGADLHLAFGRALRDALAEALGEAPALGPTRAAAPVSTDSFHFV